jgi:hypothetical protein
MTTWHYLVGQKSEGPISDDGIGELIRVGTIRRETFVWKFGFDGWKHAEDALSSLFTDGLSNINTSQNVGGQKARRGPRLWLVATIAFAVLALVPAGTYMAYVAKEKRATTVQWTNPVSGKSVDLLKSWKPTINSNGDIYFSSASGLSFVGFQFIADKHMDLEHLTLRASTEDVARDSDWKSVEVNGQQALLLTGTQGGDHELKGWYVEIRVARIDGRPIISYAFYKRPQRTDEPRSQELVEEIFRSLT